MRTALVGLLALLVVGLPVLPHGATGAPADTPLRVMIVGDSISQGAAGDATWRYWFWRELRRQRVRVDLVGPERLPKGRQPRYEARRLRFDRDHAARSGTTVDYHLKRITERMRTYRPRVVVVEVGINDIFRGDSAARVADDLRRLLNRIWARSRSTRVVLAELPPVQGNPRAHRVSARANALLEDRYADHPRVVMVRNRTETRQPWIPREHTTDGLHPNATGQTLLAQRFAEAFHRAGLLPEHPRAYRVRAWRPAIVPHVRRSGRRVTIDWSRAWREVRMTDVRVLLSRPDGRQVRDQGEHAARRKRVTRTLPRGTYRVQLVPRRNAMVGLPGPAVTVRVP